MSPLRRGLSAGAIPTLLALLALLLPAALAGQGPLAASVSPGQIAFPAPGVAEFDAGSVRFDGVAVDVQAQGFVIWVLTIQADDPDLGGYGKPLADLQWRQDGGNWQSLTTGGQVVAFGFQSRSFLLDFRTLLSWTRDEPGSYGTGITLQVSSLFGSGAAGARAPAGMGGGGARGGESPSSICARVAVAVGGARGGPGGGSRSAADATATEERCVRVLEHAVEAGRDRELRTPGSR